MSPIDLVLSRLRGVKPGKNGNWQAQCPAHQDRVASLSVSTGSDDRVLLNCFAGCSAQDILQHLDLTWTDLFTDTTPEQILPSRKPVVTTRQHWDIKDYDGAFWASHHRNDLDDGSKRIWWEHGRGKRGLPCSLEDLPLYGSHEISREGGNNLFVVEGEKARDALAGLGLDVLGTYGADHNPGIGVLLPMMRWDTIYLWPDRDRSGLLHMRNLADQLVILGHTGVRIVIDPQASWKDDAYDWVERGNDQVDLKILLDESMRAEDFLDTATIESGSVHALSTPQDTRTYTINGITYQVQYPRYHSGIEASIIAINGDEHEPLAFDRIVLDRAESREKFAQLSGAQPQDLMVLRSLLIDGIERPGGQIPVVDSEAWGEALHSKIITGNTTSFRTGYTHLDAAINGLLPQQLIVLAGQTGSGKTSFMTGILLHNILRGIRCGMISMEMSGTEVYARLASSLSKHSVSVQIATDLKDERRDEDINAAIHTLNSKPLYLSDNVPATLPAVLDYSRKLKEEVDIQMLFIDQIHSIKSVGHETRNELVGKIANSFKQLARELDIPVITAAQMNRSQTYRKDKEPVIDDIRDSAEIAHQCDMLFFVHHPFMFDDTQPEHLKYFLVAKNRDGKTGTRITMRWEGKTATFHTTDQRNF